MYNPDELSDDEGKGGKVEPGTYTFKVDDISEHTFKSGNAGYKVKLLVAVGDRDVTVFDNLVKHPKALWKIGQFVEAFGFDRKKPPLDPQTLYGRTGVAEFETGEKGYLQVKRYEKNDGPPAEAEPPVDYSNVGPAPMQDQDNVPF